MKSLGTRAPFQRQLFAFLTRRGHGLTGDVWRLLDSSSAGRATSPEKEFAHGLKLLGPAIVQGIESLCDEGRHQRLVTLWARIIVRMEGDTGARGRKALERSCLALLERAEGLHATAHFREAIEELAPVAAAAAGDPGVRARELLDRCAIAVIEEAERLFAGARYAAAIGQLSPVVPNLGGETGKRARLELARSHLANGSPGRAVHPLKEVLHQDPECVAALLLLAVVHRARGARRLATDAYRSVLALERHNQHARQELEAVEEELRQAEAGRVEAESGAAHSAATESTSASGLLGWLGLLAARTASARAGPTA